MAVNKPTSGSTVTTTSITNMYDSVKTVVNNVPVGSVSNECFGPQHLPSCIPTQVGSTSLAADSASFTAASAVTISVSSAQVTSETESDVTSQWAALLSVTGSGGYILPPCKVLVMFDATIRDITKHASGTGEGMGWFSVYYIADKGSGAATYWSATNLGAVQAHINFGGGSANNRVGDSVSIWFVIDESSRVTDWTLAGIYVKCAIATGSQADSNKPTTMIVDNANLSFVAFPKDS